MRVPVWKPFLAKTFDDVNRLLAQLRIALEPVFQLGTNRIQGYDVPAPVSSNDGMTLVWSQSGKHFLFSANALTPTIVAGGPVGSSTVVPVITWNKYGQLTNVGTATITGLTPIIVAGGPVGSSTTVPVITWNQFGQLTVVGTATIAGMPTPTRVGQVPWTLDGVNWVARCYPNQFDIPPASPSASDDEFEASALDTSRWTLDANTVTGSVDALNGITTNSVVDQASMPGCVRIQALNNGNKHGIGANDCSAIFATTNEHAQVWAKVMTSGYGLANATQLYTGGNGEIYLRIEDATAANVVEMGVVCNGNGLSVLYDDTLGTNRQRQIAFGSVGSNAATPMPIYLLMYRHYDGVDQKWQAFYSLDGWGWSRMMASSAPTVTLNATWKFAAIRGQNANNVALTPQCIATSDFIRFNNNSRLPGG